jgi:transcriptional regulator with XRE-family HTH domain
MADPDKRGISRTALIGYEQGSSSPGLREVRLLCEVLRVTPNWLVYGTEAADFVSLPSLEMFGPFARSELDNVMQAAFALMALKGHEREAILSLALSLAGRQLGDARLTGLLMAGRGLTEAFASELAAMAPDANPSTTLEQLADLLSRQQGSNLGNRLAYDDEGEVAGGTWTYPEPDKS